MTPAMLSTNSAGSGTQTLAGSASVSLKIASPDASKTPISYLEPTSVKRCQVFPALEASPPDVTRTPVYSLFGTEPGVTINEKPSPANLPPSSGVNTAYSVRSESVVNSRIVPDGLTGDSGTDSVLLGRRTLVGIFALQRFRASWTVSSPIAG